MSGNLKDRNNLIIDEAFERLRSAPDCEAPPDLRASVLRQIRALPEKRGIFFEVPSFARYAAAGTLAAAAVLLILYIHPSISIGRRRETYTKANFISDSIKLAKESYQTDEASRRASPFTREGRRI